MKKRMRLLSVLLCVAMVAGLSACGSKKEDKGGQERREDRNSHFHICGCRGATPRKRSCLAEAYNNKKNPDVEIEILGAGC